MLYTCWARSVVLLYLDTKQPTIEINQHILDCEVCSSQSPPFSPNHPFSGPNAATAQTRQRAALLAMYTTWASPSSLSSWSSSDPCDGSWAGISCSGSTVTTVYLNGVSLQRPLDPAVGDLTGLQTLSLYLTGLSGTLPSTLSALTSLTSIALWQNQLTGGIPPSFSLMGSLQQIMIGGNTLLGGSIPPQLSVLTNLGTLSFDFCGLTGSIPAQLSALANMYLFIANNNQLVGPLPIQLSVLTKLQSLILGTNSLTGGIPQQLSTLRQLTHLFLINNRLSGTLPMALSTLFSHQDSPSLVVSNAALCGPTAPWPNVDTSGTQLGQPCPSRECLAIVVNWPF